MESALLVYFFIYGIASGVTCGYIASEKNRSAGAWFFLGVLFGVFAMFAIAGVPRREHLDWGDASPSQVDRPANASIDASRVAELSEEDNAAALQRLIDQASKPKNR